MYEKTGNRTTARILIALLAVALVFTMMPLSKGVSYAATGGLTTQTPEVVVTGQGLIGGAEYTADTVKKEKSFTMDELKKMDGVTGEMYSAKKSKEPFTKSYFIVDGVKVSSLIENLASISDTIAFIADDGYTCSFKKGAAYKNGAKEEAPGLEGGRYYYDGFAKKETKEVPAVLSWAYDSTEGENGEPPAEKPSATKDIGKLRVIVGQLKKGEGAEDMNQPLFNGNSKAGIQKIVVGAPIEHKALTVGDAIYTRADVLLMDYAENSYTYDSDKGVQTDAVRGVPLSVLLAGCAKNDVVQFTAADGYDVSASGMTVGELIAKNAMLAYSAEGEGIYETAKKDTSKFGFFRLYLDGQKPAKLVDSITTIKAPVIKSVKAGKKKATVNWEQVDYAQSMVIYRSTKKNSGFKAIKTISNNTTLKYTDKKVKKGKTYYYKVEAVSGDLKVMSEAKKVKIKK